MRRTGAIALTVCATGLVVLLAVAALDERELAFTLGVVPNGVALELEPGEQACQEPIDVAAEFAAVRVVPAADGLPGPALTLTVRDLRSGRTLGRGRTPEGYSPAEPQTARVGTVRRGQRVAVCVRNSGRAAVGLYGGPQQAARTSRAVDGGRPTGRDLSLVFLRGEPASALAVVPDMFRRAALWRPGWVGVWTFWVLAALVALAVPLLLARAALAAERSDRA